MPDAIELGVVTISPASAQRLRLGAGGAGEYRIAASVNDRYEAFRPVLVRPTADGRYEVVDVSIAQVLDLENAREATFSSGVRADDHVIRIDPPRPPELPSRADEFATAIPAIATRGVRYVGDVVDIDADFVYQQVETELISHEIGAFRDCEIYAGGTYRIKYEDDGARVARLG